MIIDALLEFSDAQAVTATAISTNVADRGAQAILDNPTQDLGTGEDVYFVVNVGTAFAGLTSLQADFVSDTAVGLATAPVVHLSTGAVPLATLTGGIVFAAKLPAGSYKRYLGVKYTVAGTGTGGTVDAFITKDAQLYRAYADRQPIAGNA